MNQKSSTVMQLNQAKTCRADPQPEQLQTLNKEQVKENKNVQSQNENIDFNEQFTEKSKTEQFQNHYHLQTQQKKYEKKQSENSLQISSKQNAEYFNSQTTKENNNALYQQEQAQKVKIAELEQKLQDSFGKIILLSTELERMISEKESNSIPLIINNTQKNNSSSVDSQYYQDLHNSSLMVIENLRSDLVKYTLQINEDKNKMQNLEKIIKEQAIQIEKLNNQIDAFSEEQQKLFSQNQLKELKIKQLCDQVTQSELKLQQFQQIQFKNRNAQVERMSKSPAQRTITQDSPQRNNTIKKYESDIIRLKYESKQLEQEIQQRDQKIKYQGNIYSELYLRFQDLENNYNQQRQLLIEQREKFNQRLGDKYKL